ncbi:hypothetical protein UlMin_028639 [Ulmus minor]
MDDTAFSELLVPEEVVQTLCSVSNSSTLEKSLELLVEASRTAEGRAELASKRVLPTVVELIQSLGYPFGRQFLLWSFRVLRNLCAGEIANQDLFIQGRRIGAIVNVLSNIRKCLDTDYGIIRTGLQVLANVSLAGEEHQGCKWNEIFPQECLALAKVRRREVCDPLCMIIYACLDGNPELVAEYCSGSGLPIMREIVRTTAEVGFGEDWFKLLISRICLEQPYFPPLFSELAPVVAANSANSEVTGILFSSEQAFLLRMVSEILNERLEEIIVPNDFALCVFEIFKKASGIVNSGIRTISGLPTGSTAIDILGYSLTILRDICAQKSRKDSNEEAIDAVDLLLSFGLIELLLCLLRDLEPPAVIRRTVQRGENNEVGTSTSSSKPCPYKGFRRDIVAVIGNCTFGRKHVQDIIRGRNGILLLLQQCVTDEENPLLREWGIWSVRNLLEGNAENQQAVAELELQGGVDTPEIARLGLRVEVDLNSHRARLVNIS